MNPFTGERVDRLFHDTVHYVAEFVVPQHQEGRVGKLSDREPKISQTKAAAGKVGLLLLLLLCFVLFSVSLLLCLCMCVSVSVSV